MKKQWTLFVGLLALVMPLLAGAAPVKVDKAKAVASEFFAQHAASRSTVSFDLVWTGEEAGGRSVAEPAYYLFNRTDAPGFVLVAGDDATAPILAYSLENSFSKVEGMPSNLRWWLDNLRQTILDARASGSAQHAAWEGGRGLSRAGGEKKLNTANWGQSTPYNLQCPVLPGMSEPAVTGCVQTAAAIICQYNRWPTAPNGTTALGYSYTMNNGTKVTIPARTLAASYNYDQMPNDYFRIWYENGQAYGQILYDDTQAAAVATLMADLGVMNKAKYDTEEAGGTGATSTDFYATMTSYMRYSKEASLVYRAGYSDMEWMKMMQTEIDANRPVYYSGAGQQGGHAFVMDGYQGDDKLHFNWGWDSMANGYYAASNLNPSGAAFNEGQDAVIGLVKDEQGTSTYADVLLLGPSANHKGFVGLSDLKSKPIVGLGFKMEIQYLWNMGMSDYFGKIAFGHFARNGQLRGLISDEKSVNMQVSGGYGHTANNALSCKLTQTVMPGDYIALLFWQRKTNEWEEVRAYYEGTTTRITLLELDNETIADGTKLFYDRTTKRFSIKSYAGLTVTLRNSSGATALTLETTGEEQTIDLPAGSYTLTVGDEAEGLAVSVNVKL